MKTEFAPDATPSKCEWTQTTVWDFDGESQFMHPGCKSAFSIHKLLFDKFKFCPFCGLKIEVKS
jgi:hypothetical protein